MAYRTIAALALAGALAAALGGAVFIPHAQAGPGDPSATFIAGNAAPGETTSTNCLPNGYLEVIFSLGGAVVSRIESGTTCTPGSGDARQEAVDVVKAAGLLRDATDQEIHAWVKALDLFQQGLIDDVTTFMREQGFEDFEDPLSQEALEKRGREDLARVRAATEAELASARAELSRLRTERYRLEARLPELQAEIRALQAKADTEAGPTPAEQAELDRLAAVLVQAEAADSALSGISYHSREIAADRERIAEAEAGNVANPEEVLALLRTRVAEEEALLAAEEALLASSLSALGLSDGGSRSANAARIATVEGPAQEQYGAILAEVAARRAEARAEIEDEISQREQEIADGTSRLRVLKDDIAVAEEYVERLEDKLAHLDQRAGPAPQPGTFEALRARGIELFADASYTAARNREGGRNVEIDSGTAGVGVVTRVSERLATGVGITYTYSDSEDRTGTGVSIQSDVIGVSPFAVYLLDEAWSVDVRALYAYADVESDRAGIASGDFGSHTYGIGGGISGQQRLTEMLSVTGRAGYRYAHATSQGYVDSSGIYISGSDSDQSTASLTGRVDLRPAPAWRLFSGLRVSYDVRERGDGLDRLETGLNAGAEYDLGNASLLGQVGKSFFRNDYDATTVGLQLRVPL